MILIVISYHSKKGKTGSRGAKPLENLLDQASYMLGKRPFRKEKVLQKGTFIINVEKGRSLYLQGPLVDRYKPTAFQM